MWLPVSISTAIGNRNCSRALARRSYSNMSSSRYALKGDAVNLTHDGPMEPATMVLSADRTRLGDYAYQPAVEP
jgi:hypothetical protein